MLKQRIITAIVFGALIVIAIFKLPNLWLALILAIVTLIGAWEWSTLVDIENIALKLLYVVLVGAFMLIAWSFMSPQNENALLMLASIWWACVVILLAMYKSSWLKSGWLYKLLLVSGFIVLVPSWLALARLHEQGPETLMFLLALIWVADIAAYFVGKRFGSDGNSWVTNVYI